MEYKKHSRFVMTVSSSAERFNDELPSAELIAIYNLWEQKIIKDR
jgi:hypothetical protein